MNKSQTVTMSHVSLSVVQKFAFILSATVVLLFASLCMNSDAHADSSKEIVQKGLPELMKGARLVDKTIKERVNPNGAVLVGASTASDAQIAVLMKLLEQLIAIYTQLLADKGESVEVDTHGVHKLAVSYFSGKQGAYLPGSKISLIIKGTDLFDGRAATPEDGYNMQVYLSAADRTGGSLQGENATYNPLTKYWYTELTAPADVSKSYMVEANLYCATDSQACSKWFESGKGKDGGQVTATYKFNVGKENLDPKISVTYPNGGENITTSGKDVDLRVNWTSTNLSGNTFVYLIRTDGSTCLLGSTRVSKGTFGMNIDTDTECQNSDGRHTLVSSGQYQVLLDTDTNPQGSVLGISDSSDSLFTLNVLNEDKSDDTPYISIVTIGDGVEGWYLTLKGDNITEASSILVTGNGGRIGYSSARFVSSDGSQVTFNLPVNMDLNSYLGNNNDVNTAYSVQVTTDDLISNTVLIPNPYFGGRG